MLDAREEMARAFLCAAEFSRFDSGRSPYRMRERKRAMNDVRCAPPSGRAREIWPDFVCFASAINLVGVVKRVAEALIQHQMPTFRDE